jgi:hypothetical protein
MSMLTRRDVAMPTWYAVLFSAIVLWASRRSSEQPLPSPRAPPRIAFAPEPIDRSENLLEMRRIAQRMTR